MKGRWLIMLNKRIIHLVIGLVIVASLFLPWITFSASIFGMNLSIKYSFAKIIGLLIEPPKSSGSSDIFETPKIASWLGVLSIILVIISVPIWLAGYKFRKVKGWYSPIGIIGVILWWQFTQLIRVKPSFSGAITIDIGYGSLLYFIALVCGLIVSFVEVKKGEVLQIREV